MSLEFPTLDDADVRGKTVLVRVDINSPIHPRTGEILDDTRIRECSTTLKELSQREAKVVVLAHQGRPGDEDFTALEKHAKKLSEILRIKVRYLEDVFGPSARQAIKSLKPGEVLLLENVRFCAEEGLSSPPEELAKTHLVRRLAELADIYVNDAFAAAHRSQASLVGFGPVLPTFAGRVMERELKGLSKVLSPERPCVYAIGGAKVDTKLSIIKNAIGRRTADELLTGGLVGQVFLTAAGRDIGANLNLLLEKGFRREIEMAGELLATCGERIKMPVDVVVDNRGEPKELSVDQLPNKLPICDIGSRTIEEYSEIMAGAGTIVACGPFGIFENPMFARGTLGILRAMANSGAFTIIGGGHLLAVAKATGIADKMGHISTGGGACLSFLSGENLPVIEMLMRAKH